MPIPVWGAPSPSCHTWATIIPSGSELVELSKKTVSPAKTIAGVQVSQRLFRVSPGKLVLGAIVSGIGGLLFLGRIFSCRLQCGLLRRILGVSLDSWLM